MNILDCILSGTVIDRITCILELMNYSVSMHFDNLQIMIIFDDDKIFNSFNSKISNEHVALIFFNFNLNFSDRKFTYFHSSSDCLAIWLAPIPDVKQLSVLPDSFHCTVSCNSRCMQVHSDRIQYNFACYTP